MLMFCLCFLSTMIVKMLKITPISFLLVITMSQKCSADVSPAHMQLFRNSAGGKLPIVRYKFKTFILQNCYYSSHNSVNVTDSEPVLVFI